MDQRGVLEVPWTTVPSEEEELSILDGEGVTVALSDVDRVDCVLDAL